MCAYPLIFRNEEICMNLGSGSIYPVLCALKRLDNTSKFNLTLDFLLQTY